MPASYAVRSVDGPTPISFQIWLRVAASLFLGLFLLIHDDSAPRENACLRSNSPIFSFLAYYLIFYMLRLTLLPRLAEAPICAPPFWSWSTGTSRRR